MTDPIQSSLVGLILTEAAKTHLLACIVANPKNIGVRFSVKPSGCSGLKYAVATVEEQTKSDYSFELNDNYQLLIDISSYPFLKGMEVDYKKDGLNSELVYTNPNQKGQCGCGKSFIVE